MLSLPGSPRNDLFRLYQQSHMCRVSITFHVRDKCLLIIFYCYFFIFNLDIAASRNHYKYQQWPWAAPARLPHTKLFHEKRDEAWNRFLSKWSSFRISKLEWRDGIRMNEWMKPEIEVWALFVVVVSNVNFDVMMVRPQCYDVEEVALFQVIHIARENFTHKH